MEGLDVAALDRLDPGVCRARVERHFSHHVMAAEYVHPVPWVCLVSTRGHEKCRMPSCQ